MAREASDKEIQEDRKLFPTGVVERQDCPEEPVRPDKRLRLAPEVDLPVLIEIGVVPRDAGVKNRVELIPASAGQVELDQLFDLCQE